MRDRLIELLEEAKTQALATVGSLNHGFGEWYADYLLANGVIVPPCKVGDTVYTIQRKALGGHWEDNGYIVDGWGEYKVCEIPFSLTLWECGWKGVFLTREEAEQALQKVGGQE